MKAKPVLIFTVISTLFWGLTQDARAQTNEEIYQQFQFNFSPPGARASGMGRAFIGLADDATAAITNPAGLTNLRRTQVYFEYKNTQLRSRRLALVDSFFSGQTSTFYSEIDAFSFFNLTVPLGRVALSITRHEFLNYKEGPFKLAPRPIPGTVIQEEPGVFCCLKRKDLGIDSSFIFFGVDSEVDFKGVSYAGSVAVDLGRLKLGATISADQVDAKTILTRRAFETRRVRPDTLLFTVGETAQVKSRSSVDDFGTGVGFTVGGLYRYSENWSLGAVYSRGSRFELEQNFTDGTGRSFLGFPKKMTLNVPDRIAAGMAGRPVSRVLIMFDAVHIRYSDLLDDFIQVVAGFGETKEDFNIRDLTELHFGGEITLVSGQNPVFLRSGVFTNPDHSMRFVRPDSNADDEDRRVDNVTARVLFNFRRQENNPGFTLGAGFAIGGHFQADAAYISIADFDEFVVSVAIRF